MVADIDAEGEARRNQCCRFQHAHRREDDRKRGYTPPGSLCLDLIQFVSQCPTGFNQQVRRKFPRRLIFSQDAAEGLMCFSGLAALSAIAKLSLQAGSLAFLQLLIKREDYVSLIFFTAHTLSSCALSFCVARKR